MSTAECPLPNPSAVCRIRQKIGHQSRLRTGKKAGKGRDSGLPDRWVTSLLLLPAFVGIAGTLVNAWHSDKAGERRWHAALPLVMTAVAYLLLIFFRQNTVLAISFLLLGSAAYYAFYPIFWAIPTLMLSESAAAATYGLINSVGQLGGLAGPYAVGILNVRTHSLIASFGLIGLLYLGAAGLILTLRAPAPLIHSRKAQLRPVDDYVAFGKAQDQPEG